VQSNWYEDFFDPIVLDFWQTAVSAEQTQKECDLLEQTFALPPGSRILDIPCGHGRHSIELARRGYAITGVDLSPAFLAEAEKRAAEAAVAVEWRRERMQRIRYPAAFDAAFCWGNSFGYLEPAETVEFVAAVAAALPPGARFVLHTGIAAESVLPAFQEESWGAAGDYLYLERQHYDIASGRLQVHSILVRDGARTCRDYIQVVYSCAELVRLLATHGLELEALYGSSDRIPYQLGCRELILVARRT
jgi:2-polyprenyl-3-methyl-5-hydroxy-6-metoxy-1,4-benzoquinol methylase